MMDLFPIDAVITWVDGNDPAHKAKRALYSSSVRDVQCEDIGAVTRFASVGEIAWCVASIRRFAPFIRKIFVLTDGQDPGLEGIELVDHKVVAEGFEEYLPLFNSLGIETLMWRIPGLAEHFIYFNDDVFLTAPCHREDFFDGGRTVCYARPFSVPAARLMRLLKPRGSFGFKDAMLNAALRLGEKKTFLKTSHIPLALRKAPLARYYASCPEAIRDNLNCRFREPHQFNPQQLYYLLARREGELLIRKPGDALYMKPKNRAGYVARKIDSFRTAPDARFCCINSLDMASPEDRILVTEWLDSRIGTNLSDKR